jgi:hypothetical protein
MKGRAGWPSGWPQAMDRLTNWPRDDDFPCKGADWLALGGQCLLIGQLARDEDAVVERPASWTPGQPQAVEVQLARMRTLLWKGG